MDYLEYLISLLGGVVGGLAIAGFLAKRWLDHRLAKSFEAYKFLLTNRANACSAILLSVGRVITASRALTQDSVDIEVTCENILRSTLELEDCLRPAHFLLDKGIYDQVHQFKTTAQSLYEAVLTNRVDQDESVSQRDIQARFDLLESQRESIKSGLRDAMKAVQ